VAQKLAIPNLGAKLFVAVGDHLLEARRGKVWTSSVARCWVLMGIVYTGYGFLMVSAPKRCQKVGNLEI